MREVAIGRQPHRFDKRQLAAASLKTSALFGSSQSTSAWQGEWLRIQPAYRRAVKPQRTSPMPSRERFCRRHGCQWSDQDNSVPRFVFVGTASRVTRTASSTVCPTPASADLAIDRSNDNSARDKGRISRVVVKARRRMHIARLPRGHFKNTASVAAASIGNEIIESVQHKQSFASGGVHPRRDKPGGSHSAITVSREEFFSNGERFVRRILHDPMADVSKSMNFGLRPRFKKTFKAIGPKAPIAHSPNQRDRTIRKRGSLARSPRVSATSDDCGPLGISCTNP